MTLEEYQKKAMSTCMPSCNNPAYMLLNLVGEVGEFSSKVAKELRKGKLQFSRNNLVFGDNVDSKDKDLIGSFEYFLALEAGDILWQLSGLCKVMGFNLDDIARMNLEKLASRKANGTIEGNGDIR